MTERESQSPSWRSAGFLLAGAIALLQFFYSAWAFVDPVALAAYRGAPISPGDVTWVCAYASRTLFVATVVALLLIRKDLAVLRWVALLGLAMPVSDAVDAVRAELPSEFVYRHVGTAVYLLITFAVLSRWTLTANNPRGARAPQ